MGVFRVQRAQTDYGASADSTDVTLGTALGATTKAVARLTNVMHHASGLAAGGLFGANNDDLGSLISLPDTGTVRLSRLSTGDNANYRHAWEVLEYTGDGSDDHAIAVRYQGDITLGAASFSVDTAVAGITTLGDCVPIIGAVRGASTTTQPDEDQVIAEMVNSGGTNYVRLTRGSDDDAVVVSVTVIEFVGSAWTVQKIDHVPAVAGATETETISDVTDWSTAMIVPSHLLGDGDSGCDRMTYAIWPGSTTTSLRFRKHAAVGSARLRAYVIQNDALSVEHLDSITGAGTDHPAVGAVNPQTLTTTVTSVPDTAQAILFATVLSSRSTYSSEVFFDYRLTAANTVTWYRPRSDNAVEWTLQVVDLSGLTAPAPPASLAFDAVTETNLVSSGGSVAHTPVGTPRAVMVFITTTFGHETTDIVSGVTYGGVAMSEVPSAGGHIVKSTGEAGTVWAFFLGSGIPTGQQFVVSSGTGSATLQIYILTWTAGADCVVENTATISGDSVANPSATLALNGETCAVALGFYSGPSFTSGIAPLAGWTARAEKQFGGSSGGCYTYDTIGSADVTVGWTQTADDALAIAMAIREDTPAVPPADPTGLTATASDYNQIDLAWTDNATDETGYSIERSPDGSTWAELDTTAAGVTSYSDTTVSGSTLYFYRVRAVNGALYSGYSNTASATTPASPPIFNPVSMTGRLRWRVFGKVVKTLRAKWRVAAPSEQVGDALSGKLGGVVITYRFQVRTKTNQFVRDVTPAFPVNQSWIDCNNDRTVRRTASFVIDPSQATIVPFADHIAVFCDIHIAGSATHTIQLGLFTLDWQQRRATPASELWTIPAQDQTAHLVADGPGEPWAVASGENPISGNNGAAEVFSDLGLRHSLPVVSTTLQQAAVWGPEATWVEIVNGLLELAGCYNHWFARDGVARSQPYEDLSARPADVAYTSSDFILADGLNWETNDNRFANKIVVVSTDAESGLYATLVNDNPASPVSTVVTSRTRTKYIRVDGAPDQAALDARAIEELQRATAQYETLSLQLQPDPRRDVRELVDVTIPGLFDEPTRWQVRNWRLPLAVGGVMQMDLSRVVTL